MAGITTLIGVLKGLIGISKSIISVTSGFEQVESGLKTVTGSASNASKVMGQLRKLSYSTTFGMEELGQATTMLLNSGETTNNINDNLLMLGNLAQGDKQKFIELSSIYSKVLNLGRAGVEQIQQFTIRGVPLVRTLKDMGITGSASAEQVTEALKSLTEEGGKFAGAMDNLNDTIAGKEDFVSDTLKEIAVNFGELSGLTDTYKTVLEALRNVLDKVNNVLIEINNNPFLKSVISGVLAGATTALAIIIGGKLISAISVVITKLREMVILQSVFTALSGDFGKLAMVAGVAGLAVAGITTLANSSNEHKKALEQENEELEKKVKLLKTLGELPVDSIEYADASNQVMNDTIAQLKDRIEQIKQEAESVGNKIGEGIVKYTSAQEWASQNGRLDLLLGDTGTLQAEYEKSVAEETSQLQQQYSILQRKQRILEGNLLVEQGMLDIQKENAETDTFLTGIIEDKYEKENSELNKLQETLKKVNDAKYKRTGSITYSNGAPVIDEKIRYEIDPSYRQSVDNAEQYINEKIHDIKIRIAIEEMGDWQKVLQQTFGLSDEEATKNLGGNVVLKNGQEMLGAYNEKWNNYLNNGFGDTGTKSIEYLESAVSAIKGLGSANLNLSNSDKFKSTDKSVQGLLTTVETQFNTIFDDLKKSGFEVANMNDRQKNSVSSLQSAFNSLCSLLGDTDPLVQRLNEKLKNAGITNTVPNSADSEENTPLTDMQSVVTSFFMDVVPKITDKIGENIANAFSTGDFSNIFDDVGDTVKDFGSNIDFSNIALSLLQQAISMLVSSINSKISEYDQYSEYDISNTNPFDGWLEQFEDLFKSFNYMTSSLNDGIYEFLEVFKTILDTTKPGLIQLMAIIKIIGSIIGLVGKIFSKALDVLYIIGNFTSFGLWDKLSDLYDTTTELNDAQEEEAERLRNLNDAYSALYDAIKEQEEYYLEKKSELKGQASIESAYKVNDMILTPNGTFSTHPDDTIMAMKHPEDLLGSGKSNVIVNINNQANVEVTSRQTTDGNGNTVIDFDIISSKIASDYMTGQNGWDSAISQQQYSQTGRVLAL